MRLLDRYLFRELFTPLAYCLGGFLVFWVSYDLFTELDELQKHKLHLLDVIGYSAARMPEFLVTILPVALLLALLYTLTNHARHNEITAMRAAGNSLWRISAPYFAVGLAASVGLFALNELLVPRSTDWAERILHRYVADPSANATEQEYHGYYNPRAHRLWQFATFHFNTAEVTGAKVGWYLLDGSYPYRELKAERAVFTNDVWTFFYVTEYQQANEAAPLVPVYQTNLNSLAIPQFAERPRDIANDIRFSKYYRLNSKKLNIPLAELLEYLQMKPVLSAGQTSYFWTKFDGRLATPWTCLVVVIIAIPFSAASGRRNMFFGVAGSIFICFAFFVIQQFSLAFGSGGYLPPWLAAWLPNMLFAAAGLILMAKVR